MSLRVHKLIPLVLELKLYMPGFCPTQGTPLTHVHVPSWPACRKYNPGASLDTVCRHLLQRTSPSRAASHTETWSFSWALRGRSPPSEWYWESILPPLLTVQPLLRQQEYGGQAAEWQSALGPYCRSTRRHHMRESVPVVHLVCVALSFVNEWKACLKWSLGLHPECIYSTLS